MLGILAAGRNGSTLLMRMLDGSPDLWMYPVELNYLAKRDWLSSVPDAFDAFIDSQESPLRDYYLPRLAEPIEPREPLGAGPFEPGVPPEPRLLAFLESVRRAYAPETLAPDAMLGFKAVEVAAPGRWGELFPGLRSVHLLRDPWTNYASLKRAIVVFKGEPFWKEGDLLQRFLEQSWIPHARFVLSAAADPGTHLLVRYEELVRQPLPTIEKICRWLGIRLPAEPREQTVLGGRRLRELPEAGVAGRPSWPVKVEAGLQEKIGYEEIVTPRERDLIRVLAGDLAERLGYDVDAGRPARAGLLVRWLPPDRWDLINSDSVAGCGKAFLRRRLYISEALLSRGRR